jgi:hypothetical protein
MVLAVETSTGDVVLYHTVLSDFSFVFQMMRAFDVDNGFADKSLITGAVVSGVVLFVDVL